MSSKEIDVKHPLEKNLDNVDSNIHEMIHTIRGYQVIIDSDLALLYGVETKNLNKAVKRNIERFPDRYMFQLNKEEYDDMKLKNGIEVYNESLGFQNGTIEKGRGKHRKYLPYAFTEQGVAMLSAVLRSKTAVNVSIHVIDAFVAMRRFFTLNAQVFQRLDSLEIKQHETNKKIENLLVAIETRELQPKQGIFFNGQVFDAYEFVSRLIKKANRSIILIDNYIDESVLLLLSKKKNDVNVKILTRKIPKVLAQDIDKFNLQYQNVEIREFKESHDRFLILDDEEIYHIGASLKDLGKKWFAFSRMDACSLDILSKVCDQIELG